MSKLLYEIHITCYVSQAGQASQVASAMHWKTSEIARDPDLGNNTYYYLTRYAATLDDALLALSECVSELRAKHVIVIREKIEHIVYDVRHISK